MSCWLKESSTLLHKVHRKGPHLMWEPRLNSLQLTIHSAQATNACERRRLFNLQHADIQQSPKHDTPIFAERSCLRLYQENNSVVDICDFQCAYPYPNHMRHTGSFYFPNPWRLVPYWRNLQYYAASSMDKIYSWSFPDPVIQNSFPE